MLEESKMGGFSAGFGCGIACGMILGTGAGLSSSKEASHKKLRQLINEGTIRITDNNGVSITSGDLISLLDTKSKPKK
jgi:hypothetical protein